MRLEKGSSLHHDGDPLVESPWQRGSVVDCGSALALSRDGAASVDRKAAERISLACCGLAAVAQIFNLLYRRIVFGRALGMSHAPPFPIASQSATLRYSSD